jgi:hypothetical protein
MRRWRCGMPRPCIVLFSRSPPAHLKCGFPGPCALFCRLYFTAPASGRARTLLYSLVTKWPLATWLYFTVLLVLLLLYLPVVFHCYYYFLLIVNLEAVRE